MSAHTTPYIDVEPSSAGDSATRDGLGLRRVKDPVEMRVVGEIFRRPHGTGVDGRGPLQSRPSREKHGDGGAALAKVHRPLTAVLGILGAGIGIVRDGVSQVAALNDVHDLLGQFAATWAEGPDESQGHDDLDGTTTHVPLNTRS